MKQYFEVGNHHDLLKVLFFKKFELFSRNNAPINNLVYSYEIYEKDEMKKQKVKVTFEEPKNAKKLNIGSEPNDEGFIIYIPEGKFKYSKDNKEAISRVFNGNMSELQATLVINHFRKEFGVEENNNAIDNDPIVRIVFPTGYKATYKSAYSGGSIDILIKIEKDGKTDIAFRANPYNETEKPLDDTLDTVFNSIISRYFLVLKAFAALEFTKKHPYISSVAACAIAIGTLACTAYIAKNIANTILSSCEGMFKGKA